MCGQAVCKQHYSCSHADFLPPDLAKRAGLAVGGNPVPDVVQQPRWPLPVCPLCNQSEATFRHWFFECPVITAFCAIVKAPHIVTTFQPGPQIIDFARSITALHQVRLFLVHDGFLGIEPPPRALADHPLVASRNLLGGSYGTLTLP